MNRDMKVGVVGAVAGAVVGAVLGFLLSYWQFRLTNPTPTITIAITPPQQDPGNAKVKQVLTLTNHSEVIAKAVNFELKSVSSRLDHSSDGSITGLGVFYDPPRPQKPSPLCESDGNCSVSLGDLQPNAYATITMSYVAPALREDEIETYSDNAKTIKVVSRLERR